MMSKLAFDDLGTGTNALLLIHGHPFDRSMWRPQARAFAEKGWRVVVPDLPGYGDSPLGEDPMRQEAFAKALVDLLDELGIRQAVVGGLSMGGQIAMALAMGYPDRVLGLMLAATFETAETAEGVVQRNATADRLRREGMNEYAAELLPKMLASETIERNPSLAKQVYRMMVETPPMAAAAALSGRALRRDYAPTLRTFSGPAAIVVGTEDAFTTVDDAQRMKMLMPHSALHIIEGVGHMPNLEAEGQFNAALERLLDESRSTHLVTPDSKPESLIAAR